MSRWRPKSRHMLVVLGFFAFMILYSLKVNLSVAIVAMVETSSETQINKSASECVFNNTKHKDEKIFSLNSYDAKKLNWSNYEQGLVLGSFFWGYILTQVPGGRLADLIGSKYLLGYGVLFTSIFTILSPFAAEYSYLLFMLCRFCEGLFEGVTFPAMHSMMSKWFPKFEIGLMSTIIYSGAPIGTVVTMPLAGLLSASPLGWPSLFYITGIVGVVWFVFWLYFIYESPNDDPRITDDELQYIFNGQEKRKKNHTVPWVEMLTSVPVWALIITHFCQNWTFFTLLLELPLYLETVLGFNIKTNGFISGLPYLLQALVGFFCSFTFDKLIQRNVLSIYATRKICNTIALLGPCICLYFITVYSCDRAANIFLLSLAMGLNGFAFSGYCVTHVDMSPDHAGTLMGLTNGIANTSGIIVPIVVSWITETGNTINNWSLIFYLASFSSFISAFGFLLFASPKLQKWAYKVELQ